MDIKYRGTTNVKQGGKLETLDIYSNEPKLDEYQMKILASSLGKMVAKFYENPENVKAYEEWKKNNEKIIKNDTK